MLSFSQATKSCSQLLFQIKNEHGPPLPGLIPGGPPSVPGLEDGPGATSRLL